MAVELFFSAEAREEFNEAFDWYSVRSHAAAIGFASEVDVGIEKILQLPDRFARTFAGCQYYRLQKYPFLIVYFRETTLVTVVAIAHVKRRPGYWKKRV